jgi:ATP-binding cassette subfamily B (MDR/TAP) protein 1
LSRDLNKLQEGIGEKIGMMFFFVGTFLLSLIVAFVHGWELTLVILCMMPLMAISGIGAHPGHPLHDATHGHLR